MAMMSFFIGKVKQIPSVVVIDLVTLVQQRKTGAVATSAQYQVEQE